MLEAWTKKNSNVALGGQGAQMTKTDIIREAAQQISGAPATINTGRPTYAQQQVVVQQTTGGDDYLSLAK